MALCSLPKSHSSRPRTVVVADGNSERVLLLSEDLAIERCDTALECTVRGPFPKPSAAHFGVLWTLRTSLTPGVCTQDREIRTETTAGRRRSRCEMSQRKLATLSHTVREAFACCDSGLSLAAATQLPGRISWHKISRATCQFKATPRKFPGDTFSPHQFGPVTCKARLSHIVLAKIGRRKAFTFGPRFAVTVPIRAFWATVCPHVSSIKRLTTAWSSALAAAIASSARTKGFNTTAFEKAKFDEAEQELAVQPVLPRDVPDARRCAQAHNISWVLVRPDAFPRGPFPHLLQNLRANDAASHCGDRAGSDKR